MQAKLQPNQTKFMEKINLWHNNKKNKTKLFSLFHLRHLVVSLLLFLIGVAVVFCHVFFRGQLLQGKKEGEREREREREGGGTTWFVWFSREGWDVFSLSFFCFVSLVLLFFIVFFFINRPLHKYIAQILMRWQVIKFTYYSITKIPLRRKK